MHWLVCLYAICSSRSRMRAWFVRRFSYTRKTARSKNLCEIPPDSAIVYICRTSVWQKHRMISDLICPKFPFLLQQFFLKGFSIFLSCNCVAKRMYIIPFRRFVCSFVPNNQRQMIAQKRAHHQGRQEERTCNEKHGNLRSKGDFQRKFGDRKPGVRKNIVLMNQFLNTSIDNL